MCFGTPATCDAFSQCTLKWIFFKKNLFKNVQISHLYKIWNPRKLKKDFVLFQRVKQQSRDIIKWTILCFNMLCQLIFETVKVHLGFHCALVWKCKATYIMDTKDYAIWNVVFLLKKKNATLGRKAGHILNFFNIFPALPRRTVSILNLFTTFLFTTLFTILSVRRDLYTYTIHCLMYLPFDCEALCLVLVLLCIT